MLEIASTFLQEAVMMRMVLVFAVWLATNTAYALDPLLLELSWRNPTPVPLPAEYLLSSGGGGYSAIWSEMVGGFDHVSWADDQTVSNFNYALTQLPTAFDLDPVVSLWINDVPSNDPGPNAGHVFAAPEYPDICTTCYFSRLVAVDGEWPSRVASAGWDVTLHVPLLGNALFDYAITDIQRVVTPERQTIRFYGVVPEPATGISALLLILHFSTLRLRQAGFARP
jgi:hypothetical protein